MKFHLGYQRSDEVQLIRRKHLIGFRVGNTAGELIHLLAQVPKHAIVDEVIEDVMEEGEEESHVGQVSTIEFHEETRKE